MARHYNLRIWSLQSSPILLSCFLDGTRSQVTRLVPSLDLLASQLLAEDMEAFKLFSPKEIAESRRGRAGSLLLDDALVLPWASAGRDDRLGLSENSKLAGTVLDIQERSVILLKTSSQTSSSV
jgi:hypothetical protein